MEREIHFKFSHPLTDQQERVFIAYFKRVTEHMKDVLRQGVKSYNNPLLRGAVKVAGQEAAAQAVKIKMQFIVDNLYQYTRLGKNPTDACEYGLFVQENALKIEAPLGQGINLWDKFQKKFDLKFKLELCRELGFMPGELKIRYGAPSPAPTPTRTAPSSPFWYKR